MSTSVTTAITHRMRGFSDPLRLAGNTAEVERNKGQLHVLTVHALPGEAQPPLLESNGRGTRS